MSETTDKTKKLSEDAQGLEARGGIGFVDMIVGESGVEVPGFVPTKNEVLQLVQYWATEIIDLHFFYFLYGQSGSEESRTLYFAHRRLDTISQLIGEEEVNQSMQTSRAGFWPGRGSASLEDFQGRHSGRERTLPAESLGGIKLTASRQFNRARRPVLRRRARNFARTVHSVYRKLSINKT